MKTKTYSATFIVALLFTVGSAFAQNCGDEKSHEFDFWIGDWEVTAGGQVAGTNSIQPILDGCVLQENWVGAGGGSGSSLNFYNVQTEEWEQFWVWRAGIVIHTKGKFADGKMVLEGTSQNQQGNSQLNRITWSLNEDGTVRQFWQVSQDDGETWSTSFDGLYTKKG